MKSLSILVADDAEDTRTTLAAILGRAGHAVTCVAGGERAQKLLKTQTFDLLITDVIMPDGDGLSLLDGLRQAKSPLRILVISGGGKYFNADNCLHVAKSLGAHGALLKPITSAALFAAIAQVMQEPRASGRPSSDDAIA